MKQMIDIEILEDQINELRYRVDRHECEESNFESRLYNIERDVQTLIVSMQQFQSSLDLLNQTAIIAEITK